MKKMILMLLGLTLLFTSCSKEGGKTEAKLKLSGIASLTTGGLGEGGVVFFARSSTGEMFGKKVDGSEDNLVLSNGDWKFYAFMWEQNTPGKMMNGVVRCAKTTAKLGGTDTTIALSLTNDQCADPEFSAGKNYIDTTNNKIRFADIFLDECDEINPLQPNWHCGKDNQGSAVSYRVKFRNFKKGPGTPFLYESVALTGPCKVIDKSVETELLSKGLDVNFPSGTGIPLFIASVEMFLGSTTCDLNDAKKFQEISFESGFAREANLSNSVVVHSTKNCANPVVAGSIEEKKSKCEEYLGSWSGSSCSNIKLAVTKFTPANLCTNGILSVSTPAIKHIVTIPQPTLCGTYINQSTKIGEHPFAGGNGTLERPYKICTEWQLNQIGEYNAPAAFSSSHYKLMNDLDMNKADFGPYSKPLCQSYSANFERHYNLNPLDKVTTNGCTSIAVAGFSGVFNGNNKLISNARIGLRNVNYVGFVRRHIDNGEIKNLQFKNLESGGNLFVGGVAGIVNSINATIRNVKIFNADIDAESDYGGSITGSLSSGKIIGVSTRDSRIRANNYLGGLAGDSAGKIENSSFRGNLEHYNSSMTDTFVGGIVGKGEAGTVISKVFSEGFIKSSAYFIGGIAGKIVSGVPLTDSYSTMSILSKSNQPSIYIGGIVGLSDSTSISRVYFDGNIVHQGTGSPAYIDGITAVQASVTNCYSTLTNLSASGCDTKTRAELRSTFADTANFPEWYSSFNNFDSVPRLNWEYNQLTRLCLFPDPQSDFDTQKLYGRGVEGNPIIICNPTQLSQIGGVASNGVYYALGDDINLKEWTEANLIAPFEGNFDGRGFILYGLNINPTSDDPHAIFTQVNSTGVIKNFSIINNKIIHTNPYGNTAGVVAENFGILKNIKSYNTVLEGGQGVGAITGWNHKTIEDSFVEDGSVKGFAYVGGAAGYNWPGGLISRVSVNTLLSHLDGSNSHTDFGGIVGTNSPDALIDQVSFSGRIQFANVHSSSTTHIGTGGIAGNNSGIISNALVDNYAEISVKNFNAVGGLVGNNYSDGKVLKSLNLGKLIFNDSTTVIPVGSKLHATAGYNVVGGIIEDTFFLENNTGAYVATSQATDCSTPNYVTLTPSGAIFNYPSSTFNLATKDFSNSGNGIKNLFFANVPATNNILSVPPEVSCNTGDSFSFYKRYEPNTDGKLISTDFHDIDNFASFDIAYETGNPLTDKHVDRLYEYFKSQMENRAPTMSPPIWEMDDERKHPRLIQLDHH